jgi:hypothetical protein
MWPTTLRSMKQTKKKSICFFNSEIANLKQTINQQHEDYKELMGQISQIRGYNLKGD